MSTTTETTAPADVDTAGYPATLEAALAAFQAELPRVGKDKTANITSDTGRSYKYAFADLADVVQAVSPLLGRVGLSFTSTPTLDDNGRFVLRYALLHVSGHSREGAYPLPDPSRVTPQQSGSAITYARRYTLSAVLNIAPDEDDDAAMANQAAPAYRDRPRSFAERAADEHPDVQRSGSSGRQAPPQQRAPEPDPEVARLLGEIGEAADQAGIPRADVARWFADANGGRDIRQGSPAELQALLRDVWSRTPGAGGNGEHE